MTLMSWAIALACAAAAATGDAQAPQEIDLRTPPGCEQLLARRCGAYVRVATGHCQALLLSNGPRAVLVPAPVFATVRARPPARPLARPRAARPGAFTPRSEKDARTHLGGGRRSGA